MSSAWRAKRPWSPAPDDTGRAGEYSLDEAAYAQAAVGRSDEEVTSRTFRSIEVERVIAELWHAAAVVSRPVDIRWFAATVATLNLMGIETVLPGESALPAAAATSDRAWVNLSPHVGGDQLDALIGLVSEFHHSTVFVNGLTIEKTPDAAGVPAWSLTGRHPGIITAFGEFLAEKYVEEGWRLE